MTVEASSEDLLEKTPTFHTDVDRDLFEKLPLESQSSSVSSLVTLATPGIAADSNGLFHGMGDHAENSFSVDGQPITDQQSKVFSNQIPLDSIESMEVIAGRAARRVRRQDQRGDQRDHALRPGRDDAHRQRHHFLREFRHRQCRFQSGLRRQEMGELHLRQRTEHRALPRSAGVHRHARQRKRRERVRPGGLSAFRADSLHFNLGFTRSWFQTPNSFDMQNATAWNGLVVDNGGLGPNGIPVGPADQRSQIKTFNIAPSWTRLLSNNAVFTLGAFVRRDQYNYYPSANPFADFAPDLQTRNRGPEPHADQRRRALGFLLREGHPQHQSGSHVRTDVPERERQPGHCRSRRSSAR